MVNGNNIIIIEGTTDVDNGDLREGFNKLFAHDLKGAMPRIVMGEGKGQAINKFKNLEGSTLLCDLDSNNDKNIDQDLTENGIMARKNQVFYMIPEMETWFISQPEILDKFYGMELSKKIAKKPAKEFPTPDLFLQDLTKKTKKGAYHKIKHGVELLKALDANQLKKDFPEYNKLIEYLKSKKK